MYFSVDSKPHTSTIPDDCLRPPPVSCFVACLHARLSATDANFQPFNPHFQSGRGGERPVTAPTGSPRRGHVTPGWCLLHRGTLLSCCRLPPARASVSAFCRPVFCTGLFGDSANRAVMYDGAVIGEKFDNMQPADASRRYSCLHISCGVWERHSRLVVTVTMFF